MKRALICICVISVGWIGCGDDGVEPVETISTPSKPIGPEWLLWDDPTGTYKTGGSVSSRGHPVVYAFDWGNTSTSGWGGPEQWTGWDWRDYTRKFVIRAKARCALHERVVSASSDPLVVTIEPFESFPPETWITSSPDSIALFNTFAIKWAGSDNATLSNKLMFSYFLEGFDADWSPYLWDVKRRFMYMPDGAYTFFVKSKDEAGNEDPTPAVCSFTVAVSDQRSITVTRPLDGEILPDSTWQTIEWNYAGDMPTVFIDLYAEGEYVGPVTRSAFNDGEFDWYVSSDTLEVLDRLQLKVVDRSHLDCFGWSGEFSID